MKKDKMMILVLIVVLLSISATEIAYHNYRYPSTKFIPAHVEVVNELLIGVNTRIDALYFGKVPDGDASKRIVTMTNAHGIPVEAQISFTGDLSAWMTASDNFFRMEPREQKNISVLLTVPSGTPAGNYSGGIYVRYKRI